MLDFIRNNGSEHKSGFTLLEVLVAMAILSILLMLAIPFYQDYRTRAQVTGEIEIIGPVKGRVVEEYLINGAFPTSNAAALLENASEYTGKWVQSVSVGDQPSDGAITITYDKTRLPALGDNNTLIFYPQAINGSVSWICDAGTMASRFRPRYCRN